MIFLLTVRLKQISYSGENIGDDLSFQFDVKGQVTHVKTKISFGQHKLFNKILFQGIFAESSVSLPISVDITEEDPIFNDTGSGSSYFNFRLEQSETHPLSFSADVIASGGDKAKKATFTFIMEAVVNILNVDISTTDANPRTAASVVPFNTDNLFFAEGDVIRFAATAIANSVYSWSVDPEAHGNFNPNNVQQNTSSFTPSTRNIEPVLPLTTIGLSINSAKNVVCVQEARIVEQRAIRMLMAEARDSRISEVERQGLLWVARNRINDNRFLGEGSLNGVLQAGFADFPAAQTRDALPDFPTKREYDKITDIAGKVLSGQLADNTSGSVGFATPDASDVVIIQNAVDSNSTSDANDIGLIQIPDFPDIPDLQIVLINGLRSFSSIPRPFIFFREKTDPNSLTVLDLRGEQ